MPSRSFQNRARFRARCRSKSSSPSCTDWCSAMNRSTRLRNSPGDSFSAASSSSSSASASASLAPASALARPEAIAAACSPVIRPSSNASCVSVRWPSCSAVSARRLASPRPMFCFRCSRSASSFAGSFGSLVPSARAFRSRISRASRASCHERSRPLSAIASSRATASRSVASPSSRSKVRRASNTMVLGHPLDGPEGVGIEHQFPCYGWGVTGKVARPDCRLGWWWSYADRPCPSAPMVLPRPRRWPNSGRRGGASGWPTSTGSTPSTRCT